MIYNKLIYHTIINKPDQLKSTLIKATSTGIVEGDIDVPCLESRGREVMFTAFQKAAQDIWYPCPAWIERELMKIQIGELTRKIRRNED